MTGLAREKGWPPCWVGPRVERPVRRRAVPARSDQLVELRSQQIPITAHQLGERQWLLDDGRMGVHGIGARQALICLCASALVTSILRGLALSAIGIMRVRTPAS